MNSNFISNKLENLDEMTNSKNTQITETDSGRQRKS